MNATIPWYLLAPFTLVLAAMTPGCYADTGVPVAQVEAGDTEAYQPQYYGGNVVYYNEAGQPYYYADGAARWIPQASPYYAGYVGHWRRHGYGYRRWYRRHGYGRGYYR